MRFYHIWHKNSICHLLTYVFDEHYASKCKRQIYAVPQDGVVDSIRSLLYNYNQHSKQLVKLLLSPFQ